MPQDQEPGELGRVIASYGRHVVVETAAQGSIPCTLAARRLQVVCGDEVRWKLSDTAGRGIVVDQLPRRSTLSRLNTTGQSEAVVANVSQLVVVFAPEPVPDFFIIDRYVAAAELHALKAVVVLNKQELTADSDACQAELSVYARIGYPVATCSANTGAGIAELRSSLRSEVSVLLGQSGVGKSTLANCLLPGLEAQTAALSRSTLEGQHVTSVSTLHHLPGGGDLIDSPGVRDYAPDVELLADAAHAFREFAAPAAHCRFQDCRHLREPDCAVRSAVETGAITARRYESYRRLLRLQSRLRESRPRRARK
ncbi:MAG TPA: ribosome small subunit-dependent GTPase A [Steroidobacteraceae bacterium]|nr:ribosome small subunit-dependent GTPase A [Steroidobacteraceae bacterium]